MKDLNQLEVKNEKNDLKKNEDLEKTVGRKTTKQPDEKLKEKEEGNSEKEFETEYGVEEEPKDCLKYTRNKSYILYELRYVKHILRKERTNLRRMYQSQWKVERMQEKLWKKISKVQPQLLVTPRSLAELTKEVVANTVLRKLLISLKNQLQTCEERLLELELYEQHVLKILPDIPSLIGKEIRFFKRFLRNRRKYLENLKLFQQRSLNYAVQKRRPLEYLEVLITPVEEDSTIAEKFENLVSTDTKKLGTLACVDYDDFE